MRAFRFGFAFRFVCFAVLLYFAAALSAQQGQGNGTQRPSPPPSPGISQSASPAPTPVSGAVSDTPPSPGPFFGSGPVRGNTPDGEAPSLVAPQKTAASPSPAPKLIRTTNQSEDPLPAPVNPFAPKLPDAVLRVAQVFPSPAGNTQTARVELAVSNAVAMDGKILRVYENAAIPHNLGKLNDLFSTGETAESRASEVFRTVLGAQTGLPDWIRLSYSADFGQGGKSFRLESRYLFSKTDVEASPSPASAPSTPPAVAASPAGGGAGKDRSAHWNLDRFTRSYYLPANLLVREEEFRDGRPFGASEYDASGVLIREERYSPDGALDEVQQYDYRGTYPVRVVAFDAAGKLKYSLTFEYTMSGLVAKTEKVYPDGSGERFSYRYGTGTVAASWADDPSDGIRWVYDAKGRLVKTEDWNSGKVARYTALLYVSPDDSALVSRETVDNKAATRHLEVFDDKARVVQIDDSAAGNLVSRTIQSFDDKNRMLSKRVVTGGLNETWDYSYDGDSLSGERYAKNDVPVRVVTYQGSERVEELYLNGKALLRVYYRNNERYKEEELRDGLVVRTRDYSKGK